MSSLCAGVPPIGIALHSSTVAPTFLPVPLVALDPVVLSDLFYFFFFQAEDGIRDYKVTGVQTCALPIWIHTFDCNYCHQPAGPENHRRRNNLYRAADLHLDSQLQAHPEPAAGPAIDQS